MDHLDFKSIISSGYINNEIEFMFNNYKIDNKLQYTQFIKVLDYLKHKNLSDKLVLKHINQLDITFSSDKANYRITIDGIDNINRTIAPISNKRNHILFTILLAKLKNYPDKNITIMKKERIFVQDFDEYDIRLRISTESPLTESDYDILHLIDEQDRFRIRFRLKNRLSLELINNKNLKLSIDATSVKSSERIDNLATKTDSYEIEMDLTKFTNNIDLDFIKNELIKIKMVMEQNQFVISNSEKKLVIENYKNLVYGKDFDRIIKGPYSMQSVSLEIQHVAEYLIHKYSVDDKADGDRMFLFISSNKIYLISTNMDIKFTGFTSSHYDNTLIDGEYIYLKDYNKFLFLGFDLLFINGNDMRQESDLFTRLKLLNDVFKTIFNITYNIDDKYVGDKFELKNLVEFEKQKVDEYIKNMKNELKNNNNNIVILQKKFIFPLGISDCEIFAYSQIIWDGFKQAPYNLDGLIYTPLNQLYTNKPRDIKYNIYKWKPPSHNSIDFYIRFERDSNTGQILNIFDNTQSSISENRVYRICNLFVGRTINNIEKPIPFLKDKKLNECYLYLDNNEIRDVEGNIIMDNTVVEFAYNNDPLIDPKFRWVPLRTRYDKTESVILYKRKYGNNEYAAMSVWNSINNIFTYNDIIQLSNPETFSTQIELISSKIDRFIIAAQRQKDVYYQIKSKLASVQRQYHNWIKSIIIYMYASPKYVNGKLTRMRLLDTSIGRGGDIPKFFWSKPSIVVGLDPDLNGIIDPTDGALSRYTNLRQKMPGCPPMHFINANFTIPMNLADQSKSIINMSAKNKTMLSDFFDKKKYKFDVINCQFAIHYFFESETTSNNAFQNFNDLLDTNGYILITTLDGDLIFDKLSKGEIVSYYTDEEGKKKKFFEIIRKYSPELDSINKPGIAIDYFNATYRVEDDYETEYLVSKEYLVSQFAKYNIRLVDTMSFEELYEMSRDFFDKAAINEAERQTKNYLMTTGSFYNLNDSINNASYQNSRLYRFYVFQKN